MDMDSFRETFRERAENEVKLRLALEKIAELENLAPTEEEIDNGLRDAAESNNMTIDDVKMRIDFETYVTDLKAMKAVEFIKENAVVDNTITTDDNAEEE